MPAKPFCKVNVDQLPAAVHIGTMHNMPKKLSFEPAYRQLRQSERIFVDGLIVHIEREAIRTQEPLAEIARNLDFNVFAPHEQEMLSRSLVRSAIYERVQDLSRSSELNTYMTLKHLRALAYSSMADFMRIGDDGTPEITLENCTPEQLLAIKQIKIKMTSSGIQWEFQTHDKLTALDKVMRYQGLLNDENEHWKQVNGKMRDPEVAFDDNMSDDDIADEYSRMINGG